MKKIVALFLALCCCFCLAACGDKVDDGAGTTDSVTDTSESVSDSTGESQEILESLDVPVYNENALLLGSDGVIDFGWDSSLFKYFSGMARTLEVCLKIYPTNAVREREDGLTYVVYDTDTGYRVYRFYGEPFEYPRATGFVIVINKEKILSYNDFKDIKVGDSVLAVEAIDSVATLHKKARGGMDPNIVEHWAKEGHPWTTVHYLTDGILKINYTSPEKGTFVVSEIIFDENYNITGQDGIVVNHKIEDIDLPVT